MKLFPIIILTVFVSCLTANAQEQDRVSDTLEVYFHQGSFTWDREYKENGKRMEEFVERFRKLHNDQTFGKISKIHIIAGCSPEGRWEYNQRLSHNRASSIRRVLDTYIQLPDSVVVSHAIGVNWQALYELVEADPNVPHQKEVLDIIENTPELHPNQHGETVELRKQRLIWRFDGKAWEYMYKHLFPATRSFNLQIVIEWERYAETVREVLALPAVGKIRPSLTCDSHLSHTPPQQKVPEKTLSPHYLALKTNTIYDALAIPNIGIEFYLGKGFSMEANWMYAWWNSDPHNWYWRTYGGDLGVRKWFGRAAKEKPLTGHHVGAYGQILTYDFELGNMGIIGGKPGGNLYEEPNYTVGVEYGYSLPVAPRLNIDFTIGFGYHWGVFYEYLPVDDCYVWQATKMRHWIGPTKLGVSLTWLLGRGNVNEVKKGGRR
jgi:hypothetical protein